MSKNYSTPEEEFAWITRDEDVDVTYRPQKGESEARWGEVIRDDGLVMHLMYDEDDDTWMGYIDGPCDEDGSRVGYNAYPHSRLAAVFVQLHHRHLPSLESIQAGES